MPNAANALEVLIAYADHSAAELLARLVLEVRTDAQVACVSDGQSALEHCRLQQPGLLIADSELPGIDGLELLRQLRVDLHKKDLHFILISSRLDVQSVQTAKPLAPTAYLAKPFNADALRRRLEDLLKLEDQTQAGPQAQPPAPDLDTYLDLMAKADQEAPLLVDVREAISRRLNPAEISLRDLEKAFSKDPQITAHLIAAANRAALHSGSACQSLSQALPRLGLTRILNLVLGLSIRNSSQLVNRGLRTHGKSIWQTAERSAELAHWLAQRLGLDAELCYTAGLIHNIGELALLRCMQDWLQAGAELSDERIIQVLQQRALSFGAALRIHWRLPFNLREVVESYHNLKGGVFTREALVLNLVGLILHLSELQHPRELQDCLCSRLLQLDPQLLEQLPLGSPRKAASSATP